MKKLFVHIPKNGGSTIRRANLAPPIEESDIKLEVASDFRNYFISKKHKTIPWAHSRVRDLKQEVLSTTQPFAIIRNPWDRVVSRYTFRILSDEPNLKFEEFLDRRNLDEYSWGFAQYGWFNAFEHVSDANGKVICDMLSFENYNEDLKRYLNLLSDPIARNVSNGNKVQGEKRVGNKKPYQQFYNDRTIQLVADWYKKDIEYWGYDFDTGPTRNTI